METRSVLVTGSSTGIGYATVAGLVGAGFRTWATVRRPADAERLSQAFGDAVTPLLVDLEDEESVREAGRRVCAAGPLHGLVNNAGASLPGPLEYLPLADLRRQLEVNVVGQLGMIQAVLPALRRAQQESGDARIVLIGSIGGRIAGGMLGAYQASKHALVGLAGSLRSELAPWGIKVVLIEPGTIATAIWDHGRVATDAMVAQLTPEARSRYAPQLQKMRDFGARGSAGLAPEAVGRRVVAALTGTRPAPRQVVGRDAQVVAALVRVLPFRAIYRMTAARA